jgi:hypothetical protein
MKQRTPGNTVAARQQSNGGLLYVSEVPGDGGVDWGYTHSRERALLLNTYFARRFAADCRRVGCTPQMIFAYQGRTQS